MNTTTETLHSEIYPALFNVLPSALPEFEFVRAKNGYRSNNTRKLTGEDGDSKGKVYVYERSPGYIKDYRGDSMSIWDYIQAREALTDKRDVLRLLAELAGYSLPEQQLSPDAIKLIHQSQRISDAWEVANEFFIECLSAEGSEFAKKAGWIRDYLTNPIKSGGRGYSPALLRLSGQQHERDTPKMELGYIPGLAETKYCLQDAGFSPDEVDAVVKAIEKAGSNVGRENVLAFPYRDHSGRIKGMVFRAVGNTSGPKYLYSEFKRSEILFNLRAVTRSKNLVVVESPLDAMHAAALGISNIVALGGSGNSINKTQIDLAIRSGATRFTLMFDNDSQGGIDGAGAKGTDAAVAFLQKEYAAFSVYVGQYPDGIKDLDELLVKEGVPGFEKAKASAVSVWAYQLNRTFARLEALDTETGELSQEQTDEVLEQIVQIAARAPRAYYSVILADAVVLANDRGLPIARKDLDEAAEALRQKEFKQKQSERLHSLLSKAKDIETEKGTGDALNLLNIRSREIKSYDHADSFALLNAIQGEQQLKDILRNRPKPLNSGFTIKETPLMIPAAAVSIMAGATSHGKSVMLANLAINLAKNYEDKTFHIFSYEVDKERYLINLLNAYIGDNGLAVNNRQSIDHYFRGDKFIQGKFVKFPLFEVSAPGSNRKVDNQPLFDQKRVEFFEDLIDKGRIKVHYVTYDSDTLIEAIRYLSKTEEVGAILVDYIQLIYTPVGKLKNPSRQVEIKDMCIGFKDLVNETGLPLIFAAQFNRDVINLAQMHATKLGEAGDLERIADLILGIWNNKQKWSAASSAADLKIISKRLHIDLSKGDEPDPATWYVEVLKRRGGEVGVHDIWRYYGNAGKVASIQQA